MGIVCTSFHKSMTPNSSKNRSNGSMNNIPSLSTKESFLFENIKSKDDLFSFLSGVDLNYLLITNGPSYIRKIIGSLMDSNVIFEQNISQILIFLFEKIYAENKEIKSFKKNKIIKKILEDYYERLYKKIYNIFNYETQNTFLQNNTLFAVHLICELTEIYQVLLTYKTLINGKKRKIKRFVLWWFKSEKNEKIYCYNICDTYMYLTSKFSCLNEQIFNNFSTTFVSVCESIPLVEIPNFY